MKMEKKVRNMKVKYLWRLQMLMKISPNERATSIFPSGEGLCEVRNGGFFKFEKKTMEKSKFKVSL